jgi:hypothetical protein
MSLKCIRRLKKVCMYLQMSKFPLSCCRNPRFDPPGLSVSPSFCMSIFQRHLEYMRLHKAWWDFFVGLSSGHWSDSSTPTPSKNISWEIQTPPKLYFSNPITADSKALRGFHDNVFWPLTLPVIGSTRWSRRKSLFHDGVMATIKKIDDGPIEGEGKHTRTDVPCSGRRDSSNFKGASLLSMPAAYSWSI